MQIATIKVVDKPKDFGSPEVRFTAKDWEAAYKRGPLTLPYRTGKENIRLSGGLYEWAPEEKEAVVLKGLTPVHQMDKDALVQEMTMWGKPPRKQMSIAKAREFVEELRRQGANMITDDDE